MIKNVENNFIYAHKPSITKDIEFIDHLDSVIEGKNLKKTFL
jgi:hypothetical protein